MQKSESVAKLAQALAKFQAEVKNPKNTDTNPQYRSKYAPLDVVINTVKPILAKYGLSFMQSTGSGEGENIIIITILMHESGEWIESEPLTLPAYQLKSGGVKEYNAQGAGSSITYGRRYSLAAALGISSEDDSDGNHQTETKLSQGESIKERLAEKQPASEPAVVGAIPDVLKSKYQAFKGSTDGMEKWVGDQMAKGKTYAQMDNILQMGIDKKGKE